MAGTSPVNREGYTRFCGRLEVKSLRPTRQSPRQAQDFLFADSFIYGHVRPRRHLLSTRAIAERGPKRSTCGRKGRVRGRLPEFTNAVPGGRNRVSSVNVTMLDGGSAGRVAVQWPHCCPPPICCHTSLP